MPIPPTSGLHHITVMAGEPQQNLDFYYGVLGQRLVKRTVNFDDPATYHFYYGDEAGNPGPILTFFPWPGAGPGTVGSGETTAVGYWLAAGSVDHWLDRLGERGHAPEVAERLGDTVIAFADPDGLPLELIASADAPQVQPWANSPIPEAHRLRGFHSVTLKLAELSASAELLTGTLGYQLVAGEGERHRFRAAGDQLGPYLDALVVGEQPPGRLGVGSVHHVAFRAADDDHQAAFRERLGADGRHVTTVQERQYFRSIYFREPGGVLFEIATDGPGFATDEALDELGLGLTLPPWLETHRDHIQAPAPGGSARVRRPARLRGAAVSALHQNQPRLHTGAPLQDADAVVVLLHGRGDSAQGILGLVPVLANAGVSFLAPQAANHSWYPQRFIAPWR